jgi:Leishmanolysin
VLGIGRLWDFGPDRDLLQGSAQDPRFVGPAAIAGYLDVGGRGISVPVEEDFGLGTRLSHWDEETFDEELMTGFISLGKENPLSIMTIGSMEDLGYVVSATPAEKYQVSGRQERVAGDVSGARIDLAGRERLIKPTAVIP